MYQDHIARAYSGMLLEGRDSYSTEVFKAAHPGASSDSLHKSLDISKPLAIRAMGAANTACRREHLDVAIKDPSPVVRANAVLNPNASLDHIKSGLEDKDPYVQEAARAVMGHKQERN